MEFRRMPLPTTRYTLPYVGTAGRQRPHSLARAHAQVRGVLRRRQRLHGNTGHHLRADLQWRILPALSVAPTQTPFSRQAPRSDTGQRQVPPRTDAPTLAARASQGAHADVLATIQSRTQSHRAGLETRAPACHPQSTLSNPRPCGQRCARALQHLGQTKSTVSTTMRHYLRRYV
jgi:hypothetical protein